MDDGPYWVILLMFGSHDMRNTGFPRLTLVNETPGFLGVTHWHLNWVVGRRLTQYMGHVECRLIHACSFFSHDNTTCMHGFVVGLTMK